MKLAFWFVAIAVLGSGTAVVLQSLVTLPPYPSTKVDLTHPVVVKGEFPAVEPGPVDLAPTNREIRRLKTASAISLRSVQRSIDAQTAALLAWKSEAPTFPPVELNLTVVVGPIPPAGDIPVEGTEPQPAEEKPDPAAKLPAPQRGEARTPPPITAMIAAGGSRTVKLENPPVLINVAKFSKKNGEPTRMIKLKIDDHEGQPIASADELSEGASIPFGLGKKNYKATFQQVVPVKLFAGAINLDRVGMIVIEEVR